MRRATLPTVASFLALALVACTDTAPLPPSSPQQPASRTASLDEADEEQLDVPLAGLTAAELDRFNRGRAVFSRQFVDLTGLGPSFNSAACANCHEEPSVGGTGDDLNEDVETHVSIVAGTTCDDLSSFGGAVIQHHTTALLQAAFPGYVAEKIPVEAGSAVAHRSTPMLFGFGLIDAIPASTIQALADPTDANGDGVIGRPSLANGKLLRFGRKATDETLLGFNAGAFQNEMGITSSVAPKEQFLVGVPFPFPLEISPTVGAELSDADLALATDFVRFLRPPPQAKRNAAANDGRDLFSSIGCATCHVPSLQTGPSPVKALDKVTVAAFTDLLLHDMGPDLADICRGNTLPSEFRTEPLMGLRFRERFLHDASAETLDDAVLQHGGEATRSRDRFAGLKASQRAALIAYLNTL
jgi:CxxC motif-containing protein (DUF1111 family)